EVDRRALADADVDPLDLDLRVGLDAVVLNRIPARHTAVADIRRPLRGDAGSHGKQVLKATTRWNALECVLTDVDAGRGRGLIDNGALPAHRNGFLDPAHRQLSIDTGNEGDREPNFVAHERLEA